MASSAPSAWRRVSGNRNGLSKSRKRPAQGSVVSWNTIANRCSMPSEFRGNTNVFGVGVAFKSNNQDALRTALSVFAKCNCGEQPTQGASIYVVLRAREPDLAISDRARIVGPHLSIVQNGIALRANGCRGLGVCIFPGHSMNGGAFREAVH